MIDGPSMLLDTNPPANVLKHVVQNEKDQFVSVPGGGYRYFPLNTTVKPFDNINVRKAVMAGFDRNAAHLARGGKFVGIADALPAAGHPGLRAGRRRQRAPATTSCDEPVGRPGAWPTKYMKAAGYPPASTTGSDQLLMVGANADPGKAQAEVAKAQLEKLGFKVRLRLVPQDAVYTDWCQVPTKKVAMCGGAAGSRTSPTRSPCSSRSSRARLQPLQRQHQLSLLERPKIDTR